MKNCIFAVLIIAISSKIRGSEGENIIDFYRKKAISNSDGALIINNHNNEEKQKSSYSNNLSRKALNDIILNEKQKTIQNRAAQFKKKHVKHCNNEDYIKSAIKNNDHNALEMIKHCVNCHIIYKELSK